MGFYFYSEDRLRTLSLSKKNSHTQPSPQNDKSHGGNVFIFRGYQSVIKHKLTSNEHKRIVIEFFFIIQWVTLFEMKAT